MNRYRHLFPHENLKQISAENYLAITREKKEKLETLLKKISFGLNKHSQLIKKLNKDGYIDPIDLKLFEKANINRTALYQLILQLQHKVFSNQILSHRPFRRTSNTTKLLSHTEINSHLDVINNLSLSIEISEILYKVLYDKSSTNQHSELSRKINQLAMKVYSLPNSSNDLLTNISTELMHLALACVSLSICFFLFAAISHGALVAAAVFLCTGLQFFGISVCIQFMTQKTEIVSLLVDIIDHVKYQDLKFDYDSIFFQLVRASINNTNIDLSDALAYELGSSAHSDSKHHDAMSIALKMLEIDDENYHSDGSVEENYNSLSSLTDSLNRDESESEYWSEEDPEEENGQGEIVHGKAFATTLTPGKQSAQPTRADGLKPLYPGSSILFSTVSSRENSDEDEWTKVEAGSESSHNLLEPPTTVSNKKQTLFHNQKAGAKNSATPKLFNDDYEIVDMPTSGMFYARK